MLNNKLIILCVIKLLFIKMGIFERIPENPLGEPGGAKRCGFIGSSASARKFYMKKCQKKQESKRKVKLRNKIRNIFSRFREFSRIRKILC